VLKISNQFPFTTISAIICSIIITTLSWADPVPTTIDDFFLPGSQPEQSGSIVAPNNCDNCHGNYNAFEEPAFTWRGSMMSQAMRDPLFLATLAIANQDAPESGDLCLRCHTPPGWLEGRSEPTNGSALTVDDREGVQCDFCHKLVKPTPLGVNPYPGDPDYTSGTYPRDQEYLSLIDPIPGWSANGMYITDSDNARRGPYTDAEANHNMFYSPFHLDSDNCGTCHDVSNPVFTLDAGGAYLPNTFGEPAPDFDLRAMFPVERTFSEWSVSEYNTPGGVYAPQFGGNLDYVSTCQDCHMKDVTGKGCNKNWAMERTDLGIHDLTGGNTFVPNLIESVYPGEADLEALAAGIDRATYMLQNAASLELEVETQGDDYLAVVTVTNETGHKLPSGYPEGRRIWLNLKAYNAFGAVIYESGAYDPLTGILSDDPDLKKYEIKPGISETLAPVVNLPAGPSFHFVLNDTVYMDNRIPPRGFTNANFEDIQSPPVGYTYDDGEYWDVTEYTIPGNAAEVEVTLYYQTTSKEYIEFLRDENTTDDWGNVMYDLWAQNGRSAPVAMAYENEITPLPPPPTLWVELTPLGSVSFPPSGGTLDYNITVGNDDSVATTTDIWVDLTVPGLPDPYGPILGPVQDFTLQPGFSIGRDRQLAIPAGAPAGTYTLNGYMGEYNPPNNIIEAEDHFDFEKTGDGGLVIGENLWFVDSGEAFNSTVNPGNPPADYILLQTYPNPFNQSTAISYQLLAASQVNLSIYDITGREVAKLVDEYKPAGLYEVTFDASDLVSGVYFVRLGAKGYRQIRKIILLK